MQAMQPDLWSVRQESGPTATQEVKDESVIRGQRWQTYHGEKDPVIAAFVKRYGRAPAIIHYQASIRLWFVGPLEGSEK